MSSDAEWLAAHVPENVAELKLYCASGPAAVMEYRRILLRPADRREPTVAASQTAGDESMPRWAQFGAAPAPTVPLTSPQSAADVEPLPADATFLPGPGTLGVEPTLSSEETALPGPGNLGVR